MRSSQGPGPPGRIDWEGSSRKSCGARADGAGKASLHVWTQCETRNGPPAGSRQSVSSAGCRGSAGLLEDQVCRDEIAEWTVTDAWAAACRLTSFNTLMTLICCSRSKDSLLTAHCLAGTIPKRKCITQPMDRYEKANNRRGDASGRSLHGPLSRNSRIRQLPNW